MTERATRQMDRDTFLTWVECQDTGRYERARGFVVQQQGGTRRHSYVAARIMQLLTERTDSDIWAVVGGDLAVDVGPSQRFPEVLVERRSSDHAARFAEDPVVLVEVLSPSTAATDFGVKANEYLALRSIEAYLIASQDLAHVWLWRRRAGPTGERTFGLSPDALVEPGDVIDIPQIGFKCTVAEIYRGIL